MRPKRGNQSDKPTFLVVFLLGGFIPNCCAPTLVKIAKLEKNVFKPPPDYMWKQKVKTYQLTFEKDVPQWVLTLSLDDAAKLLSSCTFLKFELPADVLTAGEPLSGSGGLWELSRNYWDIPIKHPSKKDIDSGMKK